MYNWVHMLVWPITAIIVARTFLRAIAVIAIYLDDPEEKTDNDG